MGLPNGERNVSKQVQHENYVYGRFVRTELILIPGQMPKFLCHCRGEDTKTPQNSPKVRSHHLPYGWHSQRAETR